MLRAPTGVKEMALRGGTLERRAWVTLHEGHDLRVLRADCFALALVDEFAEAPEILPNEDELTGRSRPKPSGKKVLKPTGRKIEERSPKSSPADLILCASCGIVAIDFEPTITTKGE